MRKLILEHPSQALSDRGKSLGTAVHCGVDEPDGLFLFAQNLNRLMCFTEILLSRNRSVFENGMFPRRSIARRQKKVIVLASKFD